jgi:hypothetical protein
MKKFYIHILVFSILIQGTVFITQNALAQDNRPDFSAEIYREAIQNITDHSQGKMDRGEVLKILLNDNIRNYQPEKNGNSRGVPIYTVPEIAFATFGQTGVNFHFFPEDTFYEDSILVSLPDTVTWASVASIDSTTSLINISITANPSVEPRSTSVLIKAIINPGDTSEYTAYILQEGKPQQFILVSPKYQAVAPEGDTTEPFTVTSFNVDSITASYTDEWIHVDTPL